MENDSHTKSLEWCPEADLNHRHADFQSAALPTELSGHLGLQKGHRLVGPAGGGSFPRKRARYNILSNHVQRQMPLF